MLQKLSSMVLKQTSSIFFVTGVILTSANGLAQAPSDTRIAQAESAFSEGHFSESLNLVHDELQEIGSPQTRHRALNLVERLQTTSAELPTTDSLPDSLKNLRIRFIRRFRKPTADSHSAGDHRLSVAIQHTGLRGQVQNVELIRYSIGGSEQVLLNARSSQLSDWGGDFESTEDYIGADIDESQSLEGRYDLRLLLKNGKKASAWFVMTRGVSKEDPIIRSPENQPLSVQPPTVPFLPQNLRFLFVPFVSEQFNGRFEKRSLLAYLNYHDVGEGQNGVESIIQPFWNQEGLDPNLTELRSGTKGVYDLVPGEYRFAVDYRESFQFGRLSVAREAETIVRFFVGPPPSLSCASFTTPLSCNSNWTRREGLCVAGWKDESDHVHACEPVTQTGAIQNQCQILTNPGTCGYHNVTCKWDGLNCISRK